MIPLAAVEWSTPPGPTWIDAARDLGQGAVRLFLALGLFNASTYIFHVAVSRLLGPGEYGALAALLALVMVLSVPFSVLQTVLAKRTAIMRARGEHAGAALASGTVKGLLPHAGAAALAFVLGSPLLAAIVRVGEPSALLLGPYVLLAVLSAIPLGVLQGELRFSALAGASLAGVAVRLGVGIGLVAAGTGVFGAMSATVLAQAVTLWAALRLVRARKAWKGVRPSLAPVRGEVGPALRGLGSFWALAEADLALARHFLDDRMAGLYSSAGLIARGLLFLPAAVSLVALPRFAETSGRGPQAVRWLRASLAAVALVTLGAIPVLILAREPVMVITFGREFREGAALLPLLGPAMALMAVVNLLVYFHVAAGSFAYRLVFLCLALEATLIGLFHGGPQQVALTVTGVAGLAATLLYHAASAIGRWSPPSREVGPDANRDAPLAREPSVELSLVIPSYNTGAELGDVLAALRRELVPLGSWEIIVVSDGSTDETVAVAERFADQGVRVLHYPRRSGKGHALRVGLAEARGRYVGFIDGDGDIAPDVIRPFLGIMRLYQPDIVLGSKRHPLSEVRYPLVRRVMSWTYHKLVRALFGLNVRDTQTGLKLIRRETLAAVLPLMLEKRYAFDLELLVVARSLGFRRVFEAPVRIDFRSSGHVGLRAVGQILLDTAAIFYRRFVLGTYRLPRGTSGRSAKRRPSVLAPFVSVTDPVARNGHLRIFILNWRDIRNPEAGGAEVFTHEVARRCVAWGHEVVLVTSRFPGSRPVELVDGVRICRMGRLRTGSFHALAQRQLARVKGFDVVIDEINTIPFLTPLWRRRLPPVVALIHQLASDVLDAELRAPVATVGRWLEPRLLRLYADVPVVSVSESTRRDLLALGLRNVEVIPNGRDDPPKLDGVEKEPVPTFLFVGRLTPNKRPDHALAAFRAIRERLPDARMWIVGRGPMERTLRKSLPEGAEMLGFLPREELYRRMARGHCLLVPSVREGWGLVVIEANAVGTPAVGYDVPGIRDSIRDGSTGFLARDGDHVALADRAVALVTGMDGYAAIRGEAMVWGRGFSWDETARLFLEIILASVARSAGDLSLRSHELLSAGEA